MGREPSTSQSGGLTVSRQHTGSHVVVTLAGRLELDSVEDLAACADQICRSVARTAVFDVGAVAVVDDAGVRTLAAACRCLTVHGVVAEVRGIGSQVRQALERLGLTVPEWQRRARPGKRVAVVMPTAAAAGR